MEKDSLLRIADRFAMDEDAASRREFGTGHIHGTYLVETGSGTRYILQRINEVTFRDVPGLMENIERITRFLNEQQDGTPAEDRLRLIPTKDGKSWLQTEEGAFRMFNCIENALSLEMPESPRDFYEAAVAVGRFQQGLADFPAEELHESIPNFHNTPDRFRIFHRILQEDPMGRASSVQPEIDFYLAREKELGTLQRMREEGILPVRVTHNDTKLNNVLLDQDTRRAKCMIDLDTVMPGLSLYDYGDAIRFGASTAAEDEKDLSKVHLDLDMYRAYTEGFLDACPGLTDKEAEMLPMGVKVMTAECGLRFLTDYLDGDHYFNTVYEGQNLDRTRTQIRLVQEMEEKWEQMQAIAAELREAGRK